MIQITYSFLITAITLLWLLVRGSLTVKNRQFSWKREAELILVYICIIVVARFTFFPFSRVNGQIQPLIFDVSRMIPFRLNVVPFVRLFAYPIFREALLNLIGNTAMFLPLGVVWPLVFRKLNTHTKIIAAGAGFSLCIEILQLPFFDRVTDIDDLILNSLGYLAGYGLYLLVRTITARVRGA